MKSKDASKLNQPISNQQKRMIWAIAKKSLQMDAESLYAVIYRMFGKEHMSELTSVQAELLISELRRNAAGLAFDALTEAQYRKIMGMASEFGWSPQRLREFLENEVRISEAKWLNTQQARVVITGLEKIRGWKQRSQKEIKEVSR